MRAGKVISFVGFAVGLAAVALQFVLSINLRLGTGDNILGALIYFFSFFTILANIALLLVHLSEVSAARWLDWFRLPAMRAMMAALSILVLVTYHLLLAGIWQPQGLFLVCDITLHYVTPILYVLWWINYQPHRRVDWRDLPLILAPTVIYFVYAMARGALSGLYPYPFLEANRLGYPAVAVNSLYMLVFLVLLCVIAVIADKALSPGREDADG